MTLYIWLIFSIGLAVVVSEDNVTSDKINATGVINKLCRIIESGIEKSPNDKVDRVLEQIKYDIARLGKDSVELPDAVNKFEWKTILIFSDDNFTQHFNSEELSFKNGLLLDLSDLERYKHTKLTEEGEDIIVDTSLRYSTLVFDYQYNTKYMKLGPKEYLTGLISNTTFTVQLYVTSEGIVTLQEFTFDELGSLSLVWNEKSASDNIYQAFGVLTEGFLKPIIQSTLSRYVKETLQELIEEHNSEISY